MSVTKITSNVIADDAVTAAKIPNDAVTLAKMAAGTDGQIITYDASGNPVAVGPGTDGQVLTSTGAGSPPAFEDAGGGGGVWNVIGTAVASNSSSLTVTGIDATYDTYAISISNLNSTQVAGDKGCFRVGTSGGIISSTNSYKRTMWYGHDSNGPYAAGGDTTFMQIAEGSVITDATGGWDTMCYMHAPRGTQRVKFYGHTVWTHETDHHVGMNLWAGILAASSQAVDRVQVYFNGGNVESGRLTVYGISHA